MKNHELEWRNICQIEPSLGYDNRWASMTEMTLEEFRL